MSIDIRDLSGHRQLPGQRGVTEQTGPAANGPRGRDDAGSAPAADQVELSPAARNLKTLEQAAQTSADMDTAKVEQIRAQIAEGHYHVDADKLAGHMVDLERHLLG